MVPSIRNIRLKISYDGTDYCGWQKQHNGITIQEEIERCLCTMTTEVISLHGAGRTDAGVHAQGMIAHFSTGSTLSCKSLLRGANSMLPGAIRIVECIEVSAAFHSRFSAVGKKYHYTLFTGKILSPFLRFTSLHVARPLDLDNVRECLEITIGTHDFSSFENNGTRDKSITTGKGAVRTIQSASLLMGDDDILTLEFIGDGFLKNMVRNLVGTILDAGRNKITPEEFKEILEARDRSRAGATAPAHGLALVEVYYDQPV